MCFFTGLFSTDSRKLKQNNKHVKVYKNKCMKDETPKENC